MSTISEPADDAAKIVAVRLDGHEEVCRERYDYLKHRFDEVDRRFDSVDRKFEKMQRVLMVIGALVAAQFLGFDGPAIVELLGIVR
ncbi:MAG: hypothetical protein MPJ82_03035 [Alphaproteobacteria bacterium]|nr:hypothetical protein [Alphaproteobacteria bacterium]MDA7989275.1 hypothetical protein [Alphaproteobacteria bacterium]